MAHVPDRAASGRRKLRALHSVASLLVVALIGSVAIALSQDEIDEDHDEEAAIEEPVAQEYTDAELVADFGDAVYRIDVEGCGEQGNGTGFAISEEHIVTNWHVVQIDGSPAVRSKDGEVRRGVVVGADEELDVAILRVDEPMDTALRWAPTDSLEEGQRLVGMGYPVPGPEFAVAPGVILSFAAEGGERRWIRTDAALDRGNSGGPALTSHGEVAGVVTEMADSPGFQNVALVRPHRELVEVLDEILDGEHPHTVDCRSSFASGQDAYVPDALPGGSSGQQRPCPSPEAVLAEVTEVVHVDSSAQVRGVVRNNSAEAIVLPMVDVSLAAGAGVAVAYDEDDPFRPLGPGEVHEWIATVPVVGVPSEEAVSVEVYFLWADLDMWHC